MKIETVAPLTQLAENEGFLFRSGPFEIAFFRVGDEVRAINDVCPHAGASLSQGQMNGDNVVCPWHCWEFDTISGQCSTVASMEIETFETIVEDGLVKVKLPA